MSESSIYNMPDLSGGISRQADHLMFPNQVKDAENILFSVVDGARKRPGTRYVTSLSSSPDASSDLGLHTIERNSDEQYLVVYGRDAVTGNLVLRVFDDDGTEATVTIDSDAQTYLDLNSAGASDYRLVTILDTTFIINTTVPAATTFNPNFSITTTKKNVERLKAHTPADGTYHKANAEDTYWKYDVGGKTFAKIEFGTVTGNDAKANGIYDRTGESPHTFGVRFQKQDLGLTNASYTEATKTLTETGKFADYTFTPGDEIKIDSGSGGAPVTAGWYEIASRVDDDSITLATSITGGSGDATGVVGGEIRQNFTCERSNTGLAEDDMHEVARTFQEAFGDGSDVLVEWIEDGPQAGHFVITAPYRGSQATVIETYSLGSGTDLSAAGRPFDSSNATITAGTGTISTESERTLDIDDRWTQVGEPGSADAGLDAKTLPVKMQRTLLSPLKFQVSQINWDARSSGDNETNPSPRLFRRATDDGLEGVITNITAGSPAVVTSAGHGLQTGDTIAIRGTDSTPILDGNRTVTVIDANTFSVGVNTTSGGTTGAWSKGSVKIKDLTFYQDRLVLAGGEYVAMSQSGDIFNFYNDDFTNIVDSDPVDIQVSGEKATEIVSVTPARGTLVLDSNNAQQFELRSDGPVTPSSATINASTSVRTTGIPPAGFDNFLYFVGERGSHTVLWEYQYRDDIVANVASETSVHVDDLVPTGITQAVADSSSSMVVLIKRKDSNAWVYTPFWNGPNKVQSAWSKWTFDEGGYSIHGAGFLGGYLWLLTEKADVFTLERMPVTETSVESGFDYEVYGDRQLIVNSGTYDAVNDETSFDITPLKAQGSTLNRMILSQDFGASSGDIVLGGTANGWVYNNPVGGTIIIVPGDYSSGKVMFCRYYNSNITLPRPYRRDQRGVAQTGESVVMGRFSIAHKNTGPYSLVITANNFADKTVTFSPTGDTESVGNLLGHIGRNAEVATIEIRNSDVRSMTITGVQIVIETNQMMRL